MVDPLLLTCIGVRTDMPMLPHFVEHYRRLGIAPDRFRVLLNSPDASDPALSDARRLLQAHGVRHAEDWIAPYTSDGMWSARRDLQSRHAASHDWVLSADVDEFHSYPAPLIEFLGQCDAKGVTAVQGVFIDRIAPGGRLAKVAPGPFILDQFPIEAEAAWSIAGEGRHHDIFGTMKLMAMRGNILPSRGGHHPQKGQDVSYLYRLPLGHFPEMKNAADRFRVPTQVHHVHWTESLPRRLENRLATPGVSPAGQEYGRKQLAHLAKHDGLDLNSITVRPDPCTHSNSSWQNEIARLRRRSWALQMRTLVRKVVSL